MKGGHFCVLRFITVFDKRNQVEVERVRACNRDLATMALGEGFVPYKTPAWVVRDLFKERLDPGLAGLIRKVKALLDQEGRDDLALRVAVQPGGCSGLRYQLFFDERSLDGDVTHDFDGVNVVVDRMSAPYLSGAVIDFVDTIEKQGFTIDNPNAQGSCACGDSFN